MIKKIIHIADIHIRTFRMHDEYKEIFTSFIEDVKIKINGYKYDEIRIAVLGDLVHQKITISNEQLLLSCWFLNELSLIGKVIIIAGNHDLLENNKDRLDSISPMIKLLNNKNISYYKDSSCFLDDNIVWCNYSIFNNNQRPDIDKYKEIFGKDKTYIGLFHGPINGLVTDLGYKFTNSTQLDVFKGCDMVLCGDIHKRSELNYIENLKENGEKIKKVIPIVFSGSLIQQNYGETVSKHGYLIWDVENRAFSEHNINTRYGFYKLKINTIDDIYSESEILVNE